MAKGNSGRIVIEIDPDLKEQLYLALKKEELTMKEWFVSNADGFLKDRLQLSLLPNDNNATRKVG